jgi:hypothetical protein
MNISERAIRDRLVEHGRSLLKSFGRGISRARMLGVGRLACAVPLLAALTTAQQTEVEVQPSEIPFAIQGKTYVQTLTVRGGMPPYSVSGLPPGMTFTRGATNKIEISGTCSGAISTETITIADSSSPQLAEVMQFGCNQRPPMSTEPDFEYKAFYGIQQSQASSSSRTWKMFADLDLSSRIWNFGRFFVDLGLSSVPQQVGFKVSQVTTQGPALLKNLNVNQAVQSIDLLVGGEFLNLTPGSPVVTKILVLGGFATPLSPLESVAVYNSTPAAFTALKIPGDPQALATSFPYVALTTPDRSRFYGQYYGGLRVKAPTIIGMDSTYPLYFDAALGQNAAVTGGELRSWVLRLAGYIPIPKTPFAIIGSFDTALKKNINSTPLFLSLPTTPVTLPNPQAYIFPLAANRDIYRLGVAIDLLTVVSKIPTVIK